MLAPRSSFFDFTNPSFASCPRACLISPLLRLVANRIPCTVLLRFARICSRTSRVLRIAGGGSCMSLSARFQGVIVGYHLYSGTTSNRKSRPRFCSLRFSAISIAASFVRCTLQTEPSHKQAQAADICTLRKDSNSVRNSASSAACFATSSGTLSRRGSSDTEPSSATKTSSPRCFAHSSTSLR